MILSSKKILIVDKFHFLEAISGMTDVIADALGYEKDGPFFSNEIMETNKDLHHVIIKLMKDYVLYVIDDEIYVAFELDESKFGQVAQIKCEFFSKNKRKILSFLRKAELFEKVLNNLN